VHTLILAIDSPVLEDMLQIALDESNEDDSKRLAVEGLNTSTLPVVVLKEAGSSQVPFPLETFKKMLSSQYSLGTVDTMSIEGYRELAKMAHWLGNDNLTGICDKEIADRIGIGFHWLGSTCCVAKENTFYCC